MLLDRSRYAPEWGQPGTLGPANPVEELAAGHVDLPAVEDRREGLPQQVGAVEGPVGSLDVAELAVVDVRHVPGPTLQREARSLDGSLVVDVGGTPLLATYRVEGIVSETLHVEAIVDDLRVRTVFAHGRCVRLRHVDRHGLDARRPVFSESCEECADGVGVLSWSRPDDSTAHVVGDDRDVLVVPAVRQLIDTDARETFKRVLVQLPLDDAPGYAPDRRPRHSHDRAHRRLVRSLR